MITCTLGEKKYSVDYVTGRALREIEPASRMYAKVTALSQKALNGEEPTEEEKRISIAQAMDVMVSWFCNCLFQGQFTPDEFYDKYPVDSAMHDVAMAILAVQNQMTEVLSEFPMKPAAEKGKTNT